MQRRCAAISRLFVVALAYSTSANAWAGSDNTLSAQLVPGNVAAAPAQGTRIGEPQIKPPTPKPAARIPSPPTGKAAPLPASRRDIAFGTRKALLGGVKVWGIQLQNFEATVASGTSFDMLVTDPNGTKSGQALTRDDVALLQRKPDGSRRIAISYLSIGEAEDYRPDYFTAEYMTEDAPDWLLSENERWKGNRRISFCDEGWQRTILGDDDGKSVYNSIEWSPLYRIIDLGFDGVYLDRADVFSEVSKQCPDAARKMVAFVARLAAHARKKNPNFIVILQNAEELLQYDDMIAAIDAAVKEDLFYGVDHSERPNDAAMSTTFVKHLKRAHEAGRTVFVLDYLKDPEKRALDRSKIESLGFIPYFAPRALDHLWPPEGPN